MPTRAPRRGRRHLDSDEAVALGAGLHAANLSTAFRVRKFGAIETATYGLTVSHSGEAAAEEGAEGEEGEGGEETEGVADTGVKRMALLPRFKRIPVKRVVSLSNVTSDTRLSVAYDGLVPTGLPSPEVATYVVSGMEEVAAKYAVTGKVNVQFAVDSSGVLALAKAEAIVELPDLPPPNKTKANATEETTEETTEEEKKEEGEAKEEAKEEEKKEEEAKEEEAKQEEKEEEEAKGEEEKKEGEEGEKKEGEEEEKKEKKRKKRTSRVALNVTVVAQAVPALTEESMADSLGKLKALHLKDVEKAAAAEAKNTLESYIISTRSKVRGEEELEAVTTEEQREALLTELNDGEDWLYMEGEGANATEYKAHLAELKAMGDPMFDRAREATARPAALEAAKKFIDVTRQVVAAWNNTKPWINETHKEDFLEEIKAFEKWIGEKEAAQAEKAAHEDPVFKAKLVYSRLTPLDLQFNKLKKTPKPKPVVVSNATATNETNATDANATAAGEGAAGEEEEVVSPPGAEEGEQPPAGEGEEKESKEEL